MDAGKSRSVDLEQNSEGTTTLSMDRVSWEEGEHLNYSALAKAGGRRDLLHHAEYTKDSNSSSIEHPPSVDWFAHPTPPPRKKGTYESQLKNHWCQWNDSPEETKFPPIVSHSKPSGTHYINRNSSVTAKLPSIGKGDKEEQVNLKRLLSLDYQREWLQKRNEKLEKIRQNEKKKKIDKHKKLQEHSIKARKVNVPKRELDKRFTPRRFSNTSSKIKLPPL